LLPIRFDVVEFLVINPRRTLVGLAAAVCIFQDIRTVHLVVQEIKPILGFFLRFGM
jgi:predicted acetyltransferase